MRNNLVIDIHKHNLEPRLKALSKFKISEEDKVGIKKFILEASLGRVHKGRALLPATLLKYLFTLRVPLEYFNKPSSKLVVKDIEQFEKDLSSDKILSHSNKPFSASSKSNIKIDLKAYFKWKLGSKSVSLVGWLDCRKPFKTPDYLSEQEISKLFRACKSNQERFLIAVLFDSGARAEEFHNIRFEDIQLPSGSENFIKLTLKEEYSKTKGRVISLYWLNSLNSVRDYLEERKQQGIKPDEPIFLSSYDNTRQVLNRLGQKALGRSIHYHLFRHSSATHYASKLNRQELCYRYGWAFSSDMPDVYISRAGMVSKQLDTTFQATELEQVKRDFDSKILALERKYEQLLKKSSVLAKEVIKKHS